MATTTGKKQLAFVEKIGRHGVGIGPGVNQADAEALVARMNSGTTTGDHECAVLWMGEHLALVYSISTHYSDNGGRHYCPAHIDLAERDGVSYSRSGREIHDCTTQPGKYDTERLAKGQLWGLGRVTTATIEAHIARAKHEDAKIPAKRLEQIAAAKVAQAAETQRQETEEAEARLLAKKRKRMRKLATALRDMKPTHIDGDEARELAALVIELTFSEEVTS